MSLITANSEYVIDEEGDLNSDTLTGVLVRTESDGTIYPVDQSTDDVAGSTILDSPLDPEQDDDATVSSGERGQVAHCTNGVRALARSGASYSDGDYLVPNSAGKLVAYSPTGDDDAGDVVALALEAAGGADELNEVRFLK